MSASSTKIETSVGRICTLGRVSSIHGNFTQEQSGVERENNFRTRAICPASRPCGGSKQAQGEIFSFVPDASELTGAGATSTEVGDKMVGGERVAF